MVANDGLAPLQSVAISVSGFGVSPLSPRVKDPDVGDLIDRRYLLKREIARGGGGMVFEAEHVVTTRPVAIKLLSRQEPGWQERGERLLREAKALVIARQPNVVEALDAGTDSNGLPYLVLELLEGRALNGIIASRRTLPERDVVGVGLQVCKALAHGHRRGIIHRDVKPGNLFIARNELGEEIVKLFDFGIARAKPEAPVVSRITRDGALLGTPEYMAPEQLLGRDDVDHRIDIYALGVTLFECMTGSVPFEGTFGEVLLKVNTQPTPSLRARCRAASAGLEAVITRTLARDPSLRFATAGDLAVALGALAPGADRKLSLLGIHPPPLPTLAQRGPAPVAPEKTNEESIEGRRRFARAPYVTPVRAVQRDGSTLDGRSEDISEGGMLALVPARCESTEPIEVRFALPVTGDIVVVHARSCWVRNARVGAAAGFEFVDLSEEHRAIVRYYVSMMRAE